MIETSWLTKHEREVVAAALTRYRTDEVRVSKRAVSAKARAVAAARAYTAGDILRQLAGR